MESKGKTEAELRQAAAIRQLGKADYAWVMANKEAYIQWHIARYGVRPEGF